MPSNMMFRLMIKTLLPTEIEEVYNLPAYKIRQIPFLNVIKNGFIGREAARLLCRHNLWRYFHALPQFSATRATIALTFDCDYEEDTHALAELCELLAQERILASFACVGNLVAKAPQEYQLLLNYGHEIVNHSTSHPPHLTLNTEQRFDKLTETEVWEEMIQCQSIFEEVLGYSPQGFRTPHFMDSATIFKAAAKVGFQYVSSVPRDRSILGMPYYVARESVLGDFSYLTTNLNKSKCYPFLMIPLDCCPIHRGETFSSYHTIRDNFGTATKMRGNHKRAETVLTLWQTLLERSYETGIACIYLDPVDIVHSPQNKQLLRTMIHVARNLGWTFATMAELSEIYAKKALTQE
ncbi:MAG: polysaccharide deacetylase family protein [Caldilineaceae bacterium]